MTKQELRLLYTQKRESLSVKERLILDDLLLLQLQTFNFEGVQTVLSYWPINHKAEPNTLLFTNYLRHFVQDVQVAYPVSNFTTNTLTAIKVNEDTIYIKNKFGLTEPKTGDIIEPNEIDVVFVPNLICDSRGFRVGFGKGFYDRYLADCNEEVSLIGFNYFDPIEMITDTNNFDISLNYCITPQNVFQF